MGKVIISTHITVDGVIGPSPGDWAVLEGEGERYKFDQLLAAVRPDRARLGMEMVLAMNGADGDRRTPEPRGLVPVLSGS
jgi:hypothetical protein